MASVAAVRSSTATTKDAAMDAQHAQAATQQHERELERQRRVRANFEEANDTSRAPLTLAERVWVGATLSLILFLVLTGQLLMVLYWRQTPTFSFKELLYVLVPFNLICGLLLYNYKLAALRSPGRVPRGWTPSVPLPASYDGEATEPVEVKRTGAPRWCKVCRAPKPPRAHHCRQCARCTLRMDHHCPWLANCVGHHNYAAFIRFLAAVDVACAFHVVMLGARVADWWGPGYWRQPTTPVMVLLVLNFAFCIPVLILVGLFSLYHFYCAMCNSTTIEGWEKDRVATLVRRGRVRDIQYPYDLGPIRNLQAVLGANPLLWCWPQATPGDGLHYALREGADPRDAFVWPPKDPSRSRRLRAHAPGTAFQLSQTPFTYGDGFNPALQPSNGMRRRAAAGAAPEEGGLKGSAEERRRSVGDAYADPLGRSAVPPWHPDFQKHAEAERDDEGARINTDAEAAGLTTDATCVPPPVARRARETFPALWADSSRSSLGSEGGSESGSSVGGTRTRVRRGSEGFEVRPKRFDFAFAREETEWQIGVDGGGVGYGEDEEGEYSDYGTHGEALSGGLSGGVTGSNEEEAELDGSQAWDSDGGQQPGSEEEGDFAVRDAREERIRARLHEERTRSGTAAQPAYDPPADWIPPPRPGETQASMPPKGPLLPSEVMRRRLLWHAHLQSQLAQAPQLEEPEP